MKSYGLLGGIGLFLYIQTAVAGAPPITERLEDFLGGPVATFAGGDGQTGAPRISDILFTEIGSRNLGIMPGESDFAGGNQKRRVFKNPGQTNAYTLLDEFRAAVSYDFIISFVEYGNKGEFSIQHLRQYEGATSPQELSPTKILQGKTAILNFQKWSRWVIKSPDRGPLGDSGTTAELTDLIEKVNTLEKMKFAVSDAKNPYRDLTVPLNIPVGPEKITNADQAGDGDVFSLTAAADLIMGLATPTQQFGANLGAELFLRGTWRLVILKENDSVVRVKVQRIPKHKGENHYGQVVFYPLSLLGLGFASNLSVFGFSIFRTSVAQGTDEVFDFEYKYDLNTPCGYLAYTAALIYDLRPTAQCETALKPGVESGSRLISRHRKASDNKIQKSALNLGIVSFAKTATTNCRELEVMKDQSDTPTIRFECLNSVGSQSKAIFKKHFRSRSIEMLSVANADSDLKMSLSLYDSRGNENGMKDATHFFARAFEMPLQVPEGTKRISAQVSLSPEALQNLLTTVDDSLWIALAETIGLTPKSWQTKQLRTKWAQRAIRENLYCHTPDNTLTGSGKCIQLFQTAKGIVDTFAKLRAATIKSAPDGLRQLSSTFNKLGSGPLFLGMVTRLTKASGLGMNVSPEFSP